MDARVGSLDEFDAKGHRARLRARLLDGGPAGFHDYELLEYLLTLTIPRVDTKPLAKRLLHDFGGIGPLLGASAETLKPDPIYGSKLAAKFINCLMWQGKKATSMRIFYGAMDQIKKRMPDLNPIDVFTQAVEHVKPSVEVRSKRVGGATYQVPMQVNRKRQQSLAIRWIIDASRNKTGRPMFLRLADELMAAYRREGEAMTKRENTTKMAESNKAFAHFAW